MTAANPPADPPADPDAGLSDEDKAAKGKIKGWVKEAFGEIIAEARAADEPPPERTKRKSGGIMDSLFGASGRDE
jgi:hypothetical protein